jgi:lysozyme
MVSGFDVSKWEDINSTPQKIDFKKAFSKGLRFVFIKASQANWADEDIVYNWKSSKEAGFLRSAYHFLTWDINPGEQARYFYDLIKNDPGEIPPVVDYEWWGKEIPKNALDKLLSFLQELESLQKQTPIIYTAPGFWSEFGKIEPTWSKYLLWLAQYGVTKPDIPKPWTSYLFWQYTSHGDGYNFGCESKSVDLNYFNGSFEDLKNLSSKKKLYLPFIARG